MSNLEKTNDIESSNTPKTLAEKLAVKNKAKKVQNTDTALVLDRSSSMSVDVEPGKSRWDILQEIVHDIPGDPLTIAFGTHPEIVTKNDLGEPDGCTYMARALKLAKEKGCYKAVIVTDGDASDPSDTLEEAKDMIISIMYVGSGPRPQFLEDLANAAGGTCTVEDLTNPKEIEGKLTLLLEAGKKDQTEGRGPICL